MSAQPALIRNLGLKNIFFSMKGAKGLTNNNPGINCRDILDSSAYNLKSGLYWVRPDGDASAIQSFCDMSFQGGG